MEIQSDIHGDMTSHTLLLVATFLASRRHRWFGWAEEQSQNCSRIRTSSLIKNYTKWFPKD